MHGPWHMPEHPDEFYPDQPENQENEMSKYYIDRGAHRTYRYQAHGNNGTIGYMLGCYRTKEQAVEAVLRDKEERERYAGYGSRHGWDD